MGFEGGKGGAAAVCVLEEEGEGGRSGELESGAGVAVLLICQYNACIGGVMVQEYNAPLQGVMVPASWARR
jgi:hypothetical protein